MKLGELNSRMKDFFDIWLLSRSFDFEGPNLCEAIAKTFERRGTALPKAEPIALTPEFSANALKQAQWAGFIRRMKLRDAPALEEIVDALREFLLPPMRAVSAGGQLHLKWVGGGSRWSER